MTILDTIPTALGVAEDRILAALNALTPQNSAAWGVHPPETVATLSMPATGATRPLRLYTAQHQDGGGEPSPFVGARFWQGLILLKVFARDDATARAGLALVVAAMAALTAPAGYAISARPQRPADLPREVLAVRGLLYRVSVRRIV